MATHRISIVTTIVFLFFTLQLFASDTERFNKITFEVPMLCDSHIEKIQAFIIEESAIKNIDININNKTIEILYDKKALSKNQLIEQIEKLGLVDVVCINEKTADNDCGCDDQGCKRFK